MIGGINMCHIWMSYTKIAAIGGLCVMLNKTLYNIGNSYTNNTLIKYTEEGMGVLLLTDVSLNISSIYLWQISN